mmetsp:Transcript_2665/g.3861  ORF Transcript_2665/g.3861 Transcript_2665/m.3861 type:complete len:319 (-) Transcript_2665:243-1199(-)|eukprot:CAMPEP_0118702046 /NCGR_PEP_ID=MMETSP0800-20121206/17633_1 /TAXON_ID=210618 ORGANISM="Striatella unipunctata, Strain CCMP2910" /NCGR_SAMPLE_ID=MMETSP0800 /ASSEMBLY_ACC=CAM_ASM_000638 /LENGTH=318 /DNA_ID=CAMNT_0006603123 /DNA_START=460 /DNA_END=1416 /DNA_ORIENTATION=+
MFSFEIDNTTASMSGTNSIRSLEEEYSCDIHESESLRRISEAMKDGKWDVVAKTVLSTPKVTTEPTTFTLFKQGTQGFLLHALLTYRDVPLEVLEAVLNANPAALTAIDSKHKTLPLHVGLYTDVPHSIIAALCTSLPSSSSSSYYNTQDAEGNTPLHVATFMSCPETVIGLIEASPTEVTHTANNKLQLPLHFACSRQDANKEVIERLLKEFPESIKSKNWQQRLALHVACCWRVDRAIIELLIKAYPKATRSMDAKHFRPYDLARFTDQPDVEEIEAFVKQAFLKNATLLDHASIALDHCRHSNKTRKIACARLVE